MAAIAVRNNRKKNQKQQQQQQQQHIGVKHFMKSNSYFQIFHGCDTLGPKLVWSSDI